MRRLTSALLTAGLLAGCATAPMGPVAPAPRPRPYAPRLPPAPDLGPATILGRLGAATEGRSWSCEGESVVVLRATETTVARMRRLYGSDVSSADPVEVVRRRATALKSGEGAEPPIATAACIDNAFRVEGLRGGDYFVIARARLRTGSGAGGASYALMKRVELRAAETAVLSFPTPPPSAAAPARKPGAPRKAAPPPRPART